MIEKIVWLEDEPKTIFNEKKRLIEKYGFEKIIICNNFVKFNSEVRKLEDKNSIVLIIDIRILINTEDIFNCFNQEFKIESDLTAGLEYYKNCIKERFKNVNIFFYTSKPKDRLANDLKSFNLTKEIIITKENFKELFTNLENIAGKNI